MSAARARARLAAAAAAATLDALAHRLGRPAARAAVRYGTAVAVLGIARTAGVSWAELGLGRRELGSGARTGAAAGACAAAAVLAAAAVPATRGFFLDDRAAAATGPGGLAAGLARITFAAVPPEELTYRSALLGLWLGNGSPAGAVAWSSALFGLSHILPTRSTMARPRWASTSNAARCGRPRSWPATWRSPAPQPQPAEGRAQIGRAHV